MMYILLAIGIFCGYCVIGLVVGLIVAKFCGLNNKEGGQEMTKQEDKLYVKSRPCCACGNPCKQKEAFDPNIPPSRDEGIGMIQVYESINRQRGPLLVNEWIHFTCIDKLQLSNQKMAEWLTEKIGSETHVDDYEKCFICGGDWNVPEGKYTFVVFAPVSSVCPICKGCKEKLNLSGDIVLELLKQKFTKNAQQ